MNESLQSCNPLLASDFTVTLHIHTHTHMHTHMYTHIHTHVHTHTYTHTYTHIHTREKEMISIDMRTLSIQISCLYKQIMHHQLQYTPPVHALTLLVYIQYLEGIGSICSLDCESICFPVLLSHNTVTGVYLQTAQVLRKGEGGRGEEWRGRGRGRGEEGRGEKEGERNSTDQFITQKAEKSL